MASRLVQNRSADKRDPKTTLQRLGSESGESPPPTLHLGRTLHLRAKLRALVGNLHKVVRQEHFCPHWPVPAVFAGEFLTRSYPQNNIWRKIAKKVKDRIQELMNIDTDLAVRLLLENSDNLPAKTVMDQLNRQPKQQLAYLDKLFSRGEGFSCLGLFCFQRKFRFFLMKKIKNEFVF